MSYENIGRAIGTGAGTGITGLLGRVSDILDAPRRATWSMLSAPFGKDIQTGDDLMSTLGLDTENPFVKALGIGSEMALDPLNLVGGGLGRKLGGLIGSQAENASRLFKAGNLINDEGKALSTMNRAAEAAKGVEMIEPHFLSGRNLQAISDEQALMPYLSYGDAPLNALPSKPEDFWKVLANPEARKVYKRFDPEFGQLIEEMGAGRVLPEGKGLEFMNTARPDFAQVRGNKLFQGQGLPAGPAWGPEYWNLSHDAPDRIKAMWNQLLENQTRAPKARLADLFQAGEANDLLRRTPNAVIDELRGLHPMEMGLNEAMPALQNATRNLESRQNALLMALEDASPLENIFKMFMEGKQRGFQLPSLGKRAIPMPEMMPRSTYTFSS